MNVLILSMTTWGEMGNWLSGQSLKEALTKARPDWNVVQQAADTAVPGLAEAGSTIREISRQATSPEERFDAYRALMASLMEKYPAGMETGDASTSETARAVEQLKAVLATEAPDVIIGTKGIICRLALAASGGATPVINYVTNHMHFQFAVHRCPGATRHLVRLPQAKEYLQDDLGYDASAIDIIGYLINAGPNQPDASPRRSAGGSGSGSGSGDSTQPPHVVVVSNRGGAEYLDVLTYLVTKQTHASGTFIGINDPDLCGRASTIAAGHGAADRWTIVEKLSQADFLRLLSGRDRVGPLVLVSKASPNTIMEAVYLGIPMCLFRSGLPMEDWACDLVNEEGLGTASADAPGVCAAIERLFQDGGELQAVVGRQRAYAARVLDQRSVVVKTASILEAAAGKPSGAATVR